jgi:hypothetical protein
LVNALFYIAAVAYTTAAGICLTAIIVIIANANVCVITGEILLVVVVNTSATTSAAAGTNLV